MTHIHIAGKKTDAPPKQAKDHKCHKCRRLLEPEYGFCKHGLGSFDRCMNEVCEAAYEVYNFWEDRG